MVKPSYGMLPRDCDPNTTWLRLSAKRTYARQGITSIYDNKFVAHGIFA